MIFLTVAGLLLGPLAFTAPSAQVDPPGFWDRPKAAGSRGVLVLHPWWGLNDDTKAFCVRLAHAGFTAYAPDLFNGKTAQTEAQAQALVDEYEPKHAQTEALIDKAAQELSKKTGRHPIGVIGFSFGAYYALHLSNEEPSLVKAVVVYYGTGQTDFKNSKASYLGNFADHDRFESKKGIDELANILKQAGRPASFHTFPNTGHWFAEPSVKSAYNKQASEEAWGKTLRFLRKELPKVDSRVDRKVSHL